jgi:hypothetical protein
MVVAAPAQAVVPPGRALMIGDSLTFESAGPFFGQVLKHKGWAASVHAIGGSAPCDWVTWLPTDIATFHPTTIGIATVGNWWPSACMAGIEPNSPEYWAKYRADIGTLIAQAQAAGSHVVLFSPPPMLDPMRQTISKQLTVELKALATQYHVGFAGGIRSALGGAKYTPYKGCLPGETAAMGCVNATIAVRSLPPASDAGLHLCPVGLLTTPNLQCPMYSSGEVRFGQQAGNALVALYRPL